jgi:predicted Zn-dependent protease
MKIKSQIASPYAQASFMAAQSGSPIAQILSKTGFKDSISALEALEQWRVHEEETRKIQASWPPEKFPLHILIQPNPIQHPTQFSTQEMFNILRQWEAAYPELIRFELIAFPIEAADIVIQWDTETTLGRDFEVGHTNRKTNGKRIIQAEITLIQNPIIDGYLKPAKQKQRIQATLLHEMGHALGLEHSEQTQDVMFYRGWQHSYLTPNDLQRAKQLYSYNPFNPF